MTGPRAAEFQAAFAEAIRVVSETLRRIAEAFVSACRRAFVDLSAIYVTIEHPAANVARLRRHLSHCADPVGPALYMASEVKLGRTPPMLA